MTDTIFALSSGPGKAGVAVVRVSGPGAFLSLAHLTAPSQKPSPRAVSLRTVRDPVSRETIDKAVIVTYPGPASFTGEDVVEYQLHGSIAVVEALLTALSREDHHRLAQPGEFTRRAFENGRMDLTAAEAVADLIDAQTEAQRLQALSQMDGALSRLYDGWRDRLTRALAYVEAVIDFPDEDVPDSETARVRPDVETLLNELNAHLNDNRRGERLREGIRIAVIGAPNAGKSSLVNALARRDVAIVSSLPGTTRDVIEVPLDLGGYPVLVADTAGLRPSELLSDEGHDAIESEGIRRALKKAQDADIRLLVFDASLPDMDAATLALVHGHTVVAFNKAEDMAQSVKEKAATIPAAVPAIALSVKTGEGLGDLLAALTAKIQTLYRTVRDTPSLTRARHRAALEKTAERLEAALIAPLPELMAEDLRLAVRALGEITGRVDVEDLLDVIFRDFCIGK